MVPRKPESVTSSTVSPMDRTSVAFTKDTMIYASYSSTNSQRTSGRGDKEIKAARGLVGGIGIINPPVLHCDATSKWSNGQVCSTKQMGRC